MLTIARCVHAIVLATLTIEAWAGLALFDASRLAGFAGLHRYVGHVRPKDRPGAASPRSVVWAVDEACVWYFKRTFCLQRSFVATWMLRRHGFAATLVIGYRAMPFESHAWVELDGRVVNDLPQYQRAFTVLNRL